MDCLAIHCRSPEELPAIPKGSGAARPAAGPDGFLRVVFLPKRLDKNDTNFKSTTLGPVRFLGLHQGGKARKIVPGQ